MAKQQRNVCAICGKPETAEHNGKPRWLAVDHCHDTGKVRGLLCGVVTVIDSQPARFPIALCSFWLTADRADIALLFRHTLILVKVDPLFGLKSQVARSVTLTFIERFSSLISTLISPRIRRLNRWISP